MANVAQLVNVLGLVTTMGDRICRTALYRAFELYSPLALPRSLACEVACGSFESPRAGGIPAMTNVPELDCSAISSEAGDRLVVFVINRNPQDDVDCRLELEGFTPSGSALVHCLNGPSVDSRNTFADDEVIRVDKRETDISEVLPNCVFPAHSATAVVLGS